MHRLASLLTPLLLSSLLLTSACAPSDNQGPETCADGRCDEAVPRVHAPSLLINDVDVLGELAKNGYDLASQLALNSGRDASNCLGDVCWADDLLAESPLYKDLVETIEGDIEAIKADDSLAGVGFNFLHRLFDVSWLDSSAVRYRLVAVTNRLDLAFAKPGTCGEVRFVYRLEYEADYGVSRLPMTVMLVRDQPEGIGGCAEVAEQWESHDGRSSRLRDIFEELDAPSTMELNLQAVRWPSGARENMGGHAEYLLRVFTLDGDRLGEHPLSNTISLDLSEEEKAGLQTWIRDNVADIDNGTAQVPEEYLATKAFSVSPRGLSRMANRPFLQAFPRPEESFSDLDVTGLELVKSPAGLVRRLDTMSCQGCHQARGQAGFHIFGEEDPDAPRSNAMEVGSSPHLNEELVWRHQQLAAVRNESSFAKPRPYAERDAELPGIYGAHCGLGDASFSEWTCAPGFVCADINGEEVGMCVSEVLSAGDACHLSSVTLDEDPHRDAVTNVDVQECSTPDGAAGRCTNFTGGFPNGHCSGSCGTAEKGDVVPGHGDAICGEFAAPGFNDCLFQGKDFTECIANNGKTLRRRCDAVTPCGDDYVCAGIPGAPKGVGGCQPPYFVFQGRVDGHNVP